MRFAGLVALLAAGGAAAAGTPASERTDPRAHPANGTRHTAFAIRFTLRHAPGRAGVVQNVYRVQVEPPAHSRAACAPPATPLVTSGDAGARIRVRLRAPKNGWCRGRHHVTVWFQQGPYCAPPPKDRSRYACPRFATRELETGTTRFTVHSSRR